MDGRVNPSSTHVRSGGATSPPSSEFEAASPPMMDGLPRGRYGRTLRRPDLSDKAPEILGSSLPSAPPAEVTTRGDKQGKQGGKQGGKQYRQYMRVKFKTSVFVF